MFSILSISEGNSLFHAFFVFVVPSLLVPILFVQAMEEWQLKVQ